MANLDQPSKPSPTYTGRVVGVPGPYTAKRILEWLRRETSKREEAEREAERGEAARE